MHIKNLFGETEDYKKLIDNVSTPKRKRMHVDLFSRSCIGKYIDNNGNLTLMDFKFLVTTSMSNQMWETLWAMALFYACIPSLFLFFFKKGATFPERLYTYTAEFKNMRLRTYPLLLST